MLVNVIINGHRRTSTNIEEHRCTAKVHRHGRDGFQPSIDIEFDVRRYKKQKVFYKETQTTVDVSRLATTIAARRLKLTTDVDGRR